MPVRNTHLLACQSYREMHPAILELAASRSPPASPAGRRHPSAAAAGLDQDLKAVADADDQLAGVAEFAERVGQVVLDLVAEDPAGGDVVAVAEPAGEAENLKLGQPSPAIRAGD